MLQRLIDRHEVLEITGLTYPTIWKMMREGSFPRSVKISGRARWHEEEVGSWKDGLKRTRLKGDPEVPETGR